MASMIDTSKAPLQSLVCLYFDIHFHHSYVTINLCILPSLHCTQCMPLVTLGLEGKGFDSFLHRG